MREVVPSSSLSVHTVPTTPSGAGCLGVGLGAEVPGAQVPGYRTGDRWQFNDGWSTLGPLTTLQREAR